MRIHSKHYSEQLELFEEYRPFNWKVIAGIILVLIVGIALFATPAKAQSAETIVCLSLDDAKAVVDAEIDGSLAEGIALSSKLIRQNKCMLLFIGMPKSNGLSGLSYYRLENQMVLGVVQITTKNGSVVYGLVRGTVAPKIEERPA